MPSRAEAGVPNPAPRLEREIELGTRLHFSEWPGGRGPLIGLPDPGGPGPVWADIVLALTPVWRVWLLAPRPTTPLPAQVVETVWLLDVFGFEHPVFLAERRATQVGVSLASWYPARLAGLVLIDPDVPRDTDQLTCPLLVISTRAHAVDALRDFLTSRVQSA